MMRQLILISALAALATTARAQDASKTHYFFSVNSGVLIAKSGQGPTFTARTIHGVVIAGRLRVGGGVGVDSYIDLMTMPVFGTVSYDLEKGKASSLFFEMNYGYSHAWRPMVEGEWNRPTVTGGRMFNPAVGYRITSGKLSAYLTLGYKYQRSLSSASSNAYFSSSTEQTFNRFVVTVGLGLR